MKIKRLRLFGYGLLLALLAGTPLTSSANTLPWLGVGNAGLRGDVELLAAYGVIDGPVTTWPIPTDQILRGLSNQKRLSAAPASVRAAAQRVLATLSHHDGNPEHKLHPLFSLRTTNQASVVRPFGARARNEADFRVGADYDKDWLSARVLVGTQTHYNGSHQRFSPDGSYVGARVGGAQFYAGWLDQWYGPGQETSLILSNNARPFPKIGVMRADTKAFASPWLSWLGPWQANLFIGLLNGDRIDRDTGFVGLRINFEPLPGFEVGLTRETEICGHHHPCNVGDYFNPNNSSHNTNKVNDEAGIDFKYTHRFGRYTVSPYVQLMNEDNGPFNHAATSYLAGSTLRAPLGTDGAYWQLTAEYADSVATENWFDFGKKMYGTAYNNGGYVDGFRYRHRTIGFSLDSDSRLLSINWRLTDNIGRRWHVTYRHAEISTPQLAAKQHSGGTTINTVSAQPVTINIGEAGLDWPLGALDISAVVRIMDAVPRPSHAAHFAGEIGIRYGF